MSDEAPPPVSDPASPPDPDAVGPPGSPIAGKVIAIGLPLVIVVVTAILGVVFSNRDRRHRQGRLDGPALYAKYCTACHKANGAGNGGGIPSLLPFSLEPEAFRAHVENGKGVMPGFKGTLFESDYEQLYRYLESLDPK